ncbi:MAG: hypothetical protein ABIK28_20600 [Planctomycetota bacterium]
MCINESRRSFIKASTFIVGGGLLPLNLAGNAKGASSKHGKSAPKWKLLGKRSRWYYRIQTENGEYLVNRTGLNLLENMNSNNKSMLTCLDELSRKHPDIPLESILYDCKRFEVVAKEAAAI